MRALLIAFLCVGFMPAALADEMTASPVAGSGSGVEPPPRWELDDSDPEMKDYLSAFMGSLCDKLPPEQCDRKTKLYVEGGDRLASYAIRQYEGALAGGFCCPGTYLRVMARTESETGFQYLADLVDQGPGAIGDQQYRHAIEALSVGADERAIDLGIYLLGREASGRLRTIAITVIEYNALRTATSRADMTQLLRQIEGDSAESNGVRRRAFYALNRLEDWGVIPPRVRPSLP